MVLKYPGYDDSSRRDRKADLQLVSILPRKLSIQPAQPFYLSMLSFSSGPGLNLVPFLVRLTLVPTTWTAKLFGQSVDPSLRLCRI